MAEKSLKERFSITEQRFIGPMYLILNDLKEEAKEDHSKINPRALALAYTKFEEFEMWLNRSMGKY